LNNLGPENIIYEGQKLLVKKGATQPVPTTPLRTPTLALSETSKPPALGPVTTAVPSPESKVATNPQYGESPLALGAVFLAFIILMGVIASSLKMKG
jgi:hypothetical protein